jgi:hypothetical protein
MVIAYLSVTSMRQKGYQRKAMRFTAILIFTIIQFSCRGLIEHLPRRSRPEMGGFFIALKSVNCSKIRSMNNELNALIESSQKVPHIQLCKELFYFEGDETTGEKPEGRSTKSAFLWQDVCHVYQTWVKWYDGAATVVMLMNGHQIVTDSEFTSILNLWRLWKEQQA